MVSLFFDISIETYFDLTCIYNLIYRNSATTPNGEPNEAGPEQVHLVG